MKKRVMVIAGAFLAGAIGSLATPANACAIMLSPAERLAMGYENGVISAVALVRVTEARHIREADGDVHPWEASAKIERLLLGSYPGNTVRFERGWGQAACDDGHPPAKAGEIWVAYFWTRSEGDQQIWASYPAELAFRADSRLRAIAR